MCDFVFKTTGKVMALEASGSVILKSPFRYEIPGPAPGLARVRGMFIINSSDYFGIHN